jgi:hypothetical protein
LNSSNIASKRKRNSSTIVIEDQQNELEEDISNDAKVN